MVDLSMKKIALILMGSFLCQYGVAQDAADQTPNVIELTDDYLLGKWETHLKLEKEECLDAIEKMDVGFSSISDEFYKDIRADQTFSGYCQLNGVSTYHRNYSVSDYIVLSVGVDLLDEPLAIGEIPITSTSTWQLYPAHNEIILTMKKENISMVLDYKIFNEDVQLAVDEDFDKDTIEAMKKDAIAQIMDAIPNETVATNKVEIINQNTMKLYDVESGLELIYHRK